MVVEYTELATYKENTINAERIVIQDNDGNQYRIRPDKFGGIEIMADDGKMVIEPNVSNVVTIKTML